MAGRDESKDRREVPPARCRHGSKVPPEGHYSGSRHWTHAGQGVQEDCPLKPVSQLLGSRFARTVGTSTTTASQSRSWSGIRTWRRRRTWQRQHYSARYARIALFMMKSPAGFSEWRALQAASDAGRREWDCRSSLGILEQRCSGLTDMRNPPFSRRSASRHPIVPE